MASRGARVGRNLVIVLVLLAGLFVGADRLGVYLAERAAGDTIKSSQHLSARPEVDISGFPFLTQLARGKFDEITITAKDVPVASNGRQLDLSQVRVVLHTIKVSRDFDRVHADSATASATAGYDRLSSALGVTVSDAGGGRVKASKQLGAGLTASLSTRPVLRGDALAFTDTTVDNLGQLGAIAGTVLDELQNTFAITLPLAQLPFDVQPTGLQVGASGVVLDLTGSNLQYG